MVDMNNMFLYYIVSGKLFRRDNQMKGVLNNESKSRGINSITKYRRGTTGALDVLLVHLFAKH
ncbi:hypothetical protein HMPREF1982_01910 [Clostridiales bacterium oral taxon 876 str. F0540]|nr:hypothetical protein HMPREF1982_01910 [Clostridiales bacterium oral taxon 876 str. F0540]